MMLGLQDKKKQENPETSKELLQEIRDLLTEIKAILQTGTGELEVHLRALRGSNFDKKVKEEKKNA